MPLENVTVEDLKKDFRLFVSYQFARLRLPPPTPIQLAIADLLQNNDDHLILMAFRGVGKSLLTSLFTVWKIWNDRQLEVLIVSASSPRAIEFATFTKRIIVEDPLLKEMAPDRRLGLRDSVLAFDVQGKRPSHAPSVKAAGITGQITGSRADIIIGDDIEIPNNSYSIEARQKLLEQTNELTNVLKPQGRLIFLGTPQSEESIYRKLISTGIYNVAIFPARYPKDISVYGPNGIYLAEFIKKRMEEDPSLIGHSTEPGRFPDELLEVREASIGKKAFALQYMLDTTLSDVDKYPLKLRDAIVHAADYHRAPLSLTWGPSISTRLKDIECFGLESDGLFWASHVSEELVPYEYKVMAVDTAGKGSDETAYAIVAYAAGKIYVLDYGGIPEAAYDDKTLKTLAKKALDYNVSTIVTEENFGLGMFQKVFEPVLREMGVRASVEVQRATKQKEKRILEVLEPLFNQHKIVINYQPLFEEYSKVKTGDLTVEYTLQYQLTHLYDGRHALTHDDRVDALAMAVQQLVDRLGLSEKEEQKRIQDMLWEEEIRRWERYANRGKTKPKDIRDPFNRLWR